MDSSLANLAQPARRVITPDKAAALRIQHDRSLRDNQFSSGEVEPPPCHGGSAIIYQQLPTHYTTYKIIPITPQLIPPTISNEIPIKAYRKIGRKSYRKIYRKSCSVGNGI